MSLDDELNRMDELEKEFKSRCKGLDGDDLHQAIMGGSCNDIFTEVFEVDKKMADHVVNDLTIEFE